MAIDFTPVPGEPGLRWRSRVHDLPAIERELARIWAGTDLSTVVDGQEERRVGARTSVMNLVVVARRPEVGERCAAVITALTGRHPSRTLIIGTVDPDGPPRISADVQAYCMLPREGAPETCSERIDLHAGGETGRHLAAIAAPLLIHDLPVTTWWPGDIPLGSRMVDELLEVSDRIVVDGSSWSGSGLDRLPHLLALADDPDLAVSDFAQIRQSRWREAIASTFDEPHLQPFVRSLRRITVTYATGDEGGGRPGPANLLRPLYHLAWLTSRLGMAVERPLAPIADGKPDDGLSGILRRGRTRVEAFLRPELSTGHRGSTLRLEIEATRGRHRLSVVITGEAQTIMVEAWMDGHLALHRPFVAPRRTEVDMLAEVIESIGQNRLSAWVIRAAVALTGGAGNAEGIHERHH
jgi:glucose-6-phosphate dehydrogenase assembly protein OpcA